MTSSSSYCCDLDILAPQHVFWDILSCSLIPELSVMIPEAVILWMTGRGHLESSWGPVTMVILSFPGCCLRVGQGHLFAWDFSIDHCGCLWFKIFLIQAPLNQRMVSHNRFWDWQWISGRRFGLGNWILRLVTELLQ